MEDGPPRAIPVIKTVEQMERFEVAPPDAGLRGKAIDWWLQDEGTRRGNQGDVQRPRGPRRRGAAGTGFSEPAHDRHRPGRRKFLLVDAGVSRGVPPVPRQDHAGRDYFGGEHAADRSPAADDLRLGRGFRPDHVAGDVPQVLRAVQQYPVRAVRRQHSFRAHGPHVRQEHPSAQGAQGGSEDEQFLALWLSRSSEGRRGQPRRHNAAVGQYQPDAHEGRELPRGQAGRPRVHRGDRLPAAACCWATAPTSAPARRWRVFGPSWTPARNSVWEKTAF